MSPSSVTVSSRGVERILSGHVWIYRADVTDDSRAEPGDVVQVVDRKKRFWGQALYSSKSQIVVRLLTSRFLPSGSAPRMNFASRWREEPRPIAWWARKATYSPRSSWTATAAA